MQLLTYYKYLLCPNSFNNSVQLFMLYNERVADSNHVIIVPIDADVTNLIIDCENPMRAQSYANVGNCGL